MKPYFLYFAVAALLPSLLASSEAAQGEAANKTRPNILFIAIDDLNDWLGCYGGHPQAITPNIDKLAKSGILFSNAHCAAPVCKSSRTSLFSGRYPLRTGVFGNKDPDIRKHHPDTVFLPQSLAEADYQTLGTGKLLHGRSDGIFSDFFQPEQRWSPFTKKQASYTSEELSSKGTDNPRHLLKNGPAGRDYLFPFNRIPSDRNPNKPDGESFDWASFDLPDSAMGDGLITNWAIEKLNVPRSQSLFLGVGYYRPHIPLYAPKIDFDQYPPIEEIQLPLTREDDLGDLGEVGRLRAIEAVTAGSHATVLKHDQWREAVRAYLASVTFVDRQIGKLLAALKASPHAENTLIVLWSDHGWHLGEKQHWGKWTGRRLSTRVPLIIVPPRNNTTAPRGEICDQPVGLIDLYPTLLDYAGLTDRADLDGTSLRPLIEEPAKETDRVILTTFDRGNHALSGNGWRYLRYQEGEEELYNIERDPHEWKNLVHSKQHETQLRTMRSTLDAKLAVITK
jgi:arylsulfatase A-like enzyme